MQLELSYRTVCPAAADSSFSCGERELDQWLKKESVRDLDRGTVLGTCAYVPGVVSPAGFYAVASVAEEVRKLPQHNYHRFGRGDYFPCLQLAYLAVHTRYQKRGIGTAMAGAVISMFAEIGPRIGLPHLILVPINERAARYYQEKLGFEPYDKGARMFLPLQTALDAVGSAGDTPT